MPAEITQSYIILDKEKILRITTIIAGNPICERNRLFLAHSSENGIKFKFFSLKTSVIFLLIAIIIASKQYSVSHNLLMVSIHGSRGWYLGPKQQQWYSGFRTTKERTLCKATHIHPIFKNSGI